MMDKHGRIWTVILACAALVLHSPESWSEEPLRVVASTSTLAYFAEQIGGDLVEVEAIAAGNRDLHYVEALPSHMLMLRKTKLYLIVGLELDLWWEPLVLGSRNSGLTVVDCSKGIDPLEVPTFKPDARFGDLHRFGNPHYWLDPENIPLICRTIADAFVLADSQHAEQYTNRLDAYLAQYSQALERWRSQRGGLEQIRFIAYHNSWPYFSRFFGCKAVGFVEEYPGVAPSPSHLAKLIERIKGESIPVVVYEPFHDRRVPEMLAQKTGCTALQLSESVGGTQGTESYEGLIDTIIAALTKITGSQP